MKAPPYIQLSGLLHYLAEALRTDERLLDYMGSPHRIVAKVAEHDPFEAPRPGKPRKLYATELPLLAIWETGVAPARMRGKREGELVDLALLYIFNQLHGGHDEQGRVISSEAWASRISKIVWWQIQHHLRRHRLDGAEGFDLYTEAHIDYVKAGSAERIGGKELEGLAAELEMQHYTPPWGPPSARLLRIIHTELHLADDVTEPPSGVVVESEIDVQS
jgi:hypothetical protein